MYRPKALSMSKGLHREKAMRSMSENFSPCTSTDKEEEEEEERFSNEILGIIHDVIPNSPSANAGLVSGEKLISIGRVDFSVIEKQGNTALVEEINQHENKPLVMVVLGSNGYLRYVKVVPSRWEGEGLLGCTLVMTLERRSRSLTPGRGSEKAQAEELEEGEVKVKREKSYPSNMVSEGDQPCPTEAARTEAARTEPARTEPARTEPARTEAARRLSVPVLSQAIQILKVVAIPVGFVGRAACKVSLLPVRLQYAVIDPFLALQMEVMYTSLDVTSSVLGFALLFSFTAARLFLVSSDHALTWTMSSALKLNPFLLLRSLLVTFARNLALPLLHGFRNLRSLLAWTSTIFFPKPFLFQSWFYKLLSTIASKTIGKGSVTSAALVSQLARVGRRTMRWPFELAVELVKDGKRRLEEKMMKHEFLQVDLYAVTHNFEVDESQWELFVCEFYGNDKNRKRRERKMKLARRNNTIAMATRGEGVLALRGSTLWTSSFKQKSDVGQVWYKYFLQRKGWRRKTRVWESGCFRRFDTSLGYNKMIIEDVFKLSLHPLSERIPRQYLDEDVEVDRQVKVPFWSDEGDVNLLLVLDTGVKKTSPVRRFCGNLLQVPMGCLSSVSEQIAAARRNLLDFVTRQELEINWMTTPDMPPHCHPKEVVLVDSYNQWSKKTVMNRLAYGINEFRTTLKLPAGQHQLAFYVDGERLCSPNYPLIEVEGSEDYNNIISIRHSPTILRKLSLLLLGIFNPRNLLSFQFLVVNAVMKLDLLTVDDIMLLSKNPTLSYNAAREHLVRNFLRQSKEYIMYVIEMPMKAARSIRRILSLLDSGEEQICCDQDTLQRLNKLEEVDALHSQLQERRTMAMLATRAVQLETVCLAMSV